MKRLGGRGACAPRRKAPHKQARNSPSWLQTITSRPVSPPSQARAGWSNARIYDPDDQVNKELLERMRGVLRRARLTKERLTFVQIFREIGGRGRSADSSRYLRAMRILRDRCTAGEFEHLGNNRNAVYWMADERTDG